MQSLGGILKRFLPFFKDYIPYFLLAIFGMTLASGGTAFSAYLVKPLLDEIFIAKDKEMLQLLPYAIIVVYAANCCAIVLYFASKASCALSFCSVNFVCLDNIFDS